MGKLFGITETAASAGTSPPPRCTPRDRVAARARAGGRTPLLQHLKPAERAELSGEEQAPRQKRDSHQQPVTHGLPVSQRLQHGAEAPSTP